MLRLSSGYPSLDGKDYTKLAISVGSAHWTESLTGNFGNVCVGACCAPYFPAINTH